MAQTTLVPTLRTLVEEPGPRLVPAHAEQRAPMFRGGLPKEALPPPRVVRVGGQIKAPQLVNKVDPVYPELAKQARLSAFIILEATVGTTGRVRDVTVLRGAPLFDEAAMDAVRRWIYKPLLLNGVPTTFVLTVTLKFNLKAAPAATAGTS